MRSIPGSSWWFLFLMLVLVLGGCGGTTVAPDASAPADAAIGDANRADSTIVDDAGADAASPDAFAVDAGDVDGGDPCDACASDQACVRGVCLTTCGADLSGFDAALAAELIPVANYCRTPSAFGFAGGRVYEVSASTVGLVTTFTLARWTPGSGATPTVETLGVTTYTASGATEMVFTGGFVAVDPGETQIVFGYTTTRPGSLGGVFDLATGSVLAVETDAPGNFDATFVDATHYVVDGLGLGMTGTQGLYRGVGGTMGGVQVVENLGQYSGSVALWEDEGLVLAGGGTFSAAWPDGETGDRVLVLPVADLVAATAPIDGDAATVQHIVMPSSFELVSGPRLASLHYDSSFAQDAIEVRTITRAGSDPIVVGEPENLTTGATFFSLGAADDQIILAHGDGLLFVR